MGDPSVSISCCCSNGADDYTEKLKIIAAQSDDNGDEYPMEIDDNEYVCKCYNCCKLFQSYSMTIPQQGLCSDCKFQVTCYRESGVRTISSDMLKGIAAVSQKAVVLK
jgi:hypothetical protein